MWSTTQVPFLYQRDLAQALGIGGDRVRVLQPPVGGNFGRGLDLYPIDVIAALLARRARRPVKIEFERLEEFVACPTREPCTIRLRTAADADGRLLARDCHVVIDNGAYVSWGSTTPYVMLSTVAGLYRCPAVRFDTTIAYTNNPVLGLDARLRQPRIDVRRREPDGRARRPARPRSARDPPAQRDPARRRQPPGLRHHLLRDGASAWTRWPTRCAARCRRRRPAGSAASATPACSTSAAARASTARTAAAPSSSCDDFGRVSLITGATEIGQGSETVLAMIVAETLGVPLERVEVLNSDTSVKPWDVGAHASRTTFIAGNAARLAAEKLRASAAGHGRRRAGGPGRAARAPPAASSSCDDEPQRRIAYDRAARAGHLRDARADAGGRGVLRSADRDARQGPARQRVGHLRLRRPGGGARRGAGDRRHPGSAYRLRPRRRPGAQPAGRRGPDPRGHPHGARLRAERAAGRAGGPGADRVVHGLRDPQGRRHAGDRRAPDRGRRRRGAVRRQGPRRVRRHPGLGGGGQRGQGRDRRALHRAADHRRRSCTPHWSPAEPAREALRGRAGARSQSACWPGPTARCCWPTWAPR